MSADVVHGSGHDEHGHGHGSRFIQHHYDDAQHQFDSGKLGIWLFLAQEVLFFSALFVAYVLYRHHHPEIYGYAHKYLDVKYGAINTAVLIFSSMTAAWAVRAAQLNQRKLLIGCLFVTILCACTFLGIKYIEYTHKYHEQLLFGRYFDPCVTAADTPLVTKKNECPGHESSVWWENDQPQTGCLPMIAIDQNRDAPGLELSCQVHQAELAVQVVPKKESKKAPKLENGQPVKDKDGKPVMEEVKDAAGNVVMEDVKEDDGRPVRCEPKRHPGDTITNPKCEVATDKLGRWLFVEERVEQVKKQCPPPSHGEHAEHGPHEACWSATEQPAVCRPGYYFQLSCAAGSTCEKDWPNKGKDGYLAPQISARYGSAADCELARYDRNVTLTKQNKADEKAAVPLSGLSVSGSCVRSEAVGFVVDYGDHEEREARAVAVCAPPPKPFGAQGDVFGEAQAQQVKLGEKATATAAEAHDAHADHEALYHGPPPDHTNMFFSIYFAMTGLHGIHVLVGVIVFIWLLIRAIKGHFTPDYFGPIDFAALYWHIVDLIWIFLFPLLYLIH